MKKIARTARILLGLLALGLLSSHPARAEENKVDPKLGDYLKVSGIGGNLDSIGSDTLNNLMTFWAESFRKQYPNVKIQIEGKGSSTAPPALIGGTAQLGPMSRTMKSSEADAFEKKYHCKPTAIGVALDSLAVFVNKDNPVKSLTLGQLDGIFSKTLKSGSPDLKSWDNLKVGGVLANKPISLYGRNSASGTYGYFKEHALEKGDFKDTVKEQPGSASVVQGVSSDLTAIGYSGIGYKTSGVRAVPLAKKEGEPAFEADYAHVLSGKYPLSRMLFIYVVKEPGKPLPPLVEEFLKFVLSREGQEIVIKDGYLPLTAELASKQARMLK